MENSHSDTNTYVPLLMAQVTDHSMSLGRIPAPEFFSDANLLFHTIMAVDRWYDFNCYTIFGDAYNLEVEALGGKLVFSDMAMPTIDIREPLIKKPADLSKLNPLDPTKGRIPFNLQITKLMKDNIGPEAPAHCTGPFSFICQAMGYPNVIRAMRRDKSFAEDLFEYAENEVVWPHVAALAKVGAKRINGMDAWCVFPNITPELGEEWVVPSAHRLIERGKKELGIELKIGNCVCEYCEEDVTKFDKDLMFRCYDVMQKITQGRMLFNLQGRTQDWNTEWVQEYALTHGSGGGKIPIFISLNARFMRDSSPEIIFEKVREWIDIMGRDGDLILGIGNVPADTPPVNIHTAVHAIKLLGQYPIKENLLSIPVEIPSFQPFDEWLKNQPEADIILGARK